MSKIILEPTLVPSSSWFNNVRSAVSVKQWDVIRRRVYDAAYNICEICGGVGKKHPVEAHEVWEYNDVTNIQKLTRMIALCPNCHSVCHFGLAQMQGRAEPVFRHFLKINKISPQVGNKVIAEAFKIWEKRSKKSWTVDLSHLKEYGIDPETLKKS